MTIETLKVNSLSEIFKTFPLTAEGEAAKGNDGIELMPKPWFFKIENKKKYNKEVEKIIAIFSNIKEDEKRTLGNTLLNVLNAKDSCSRGYELGYMKVMLQDAFKGQSQKKRNLYRKILIMIKQ